jgi:hypothetical protein
MLDHRAVVQIINREQCAQLQSAWWQLNPRMGFNGMHVRHSDLSHSGSSLERPSWTELHVSGELHALRHTKMTLLRAARPGVTVRVPVGVQ